MIKKLLIFVSICALVGIAIGTYEWFKPRQKVEDKKAVVVTAIELCKSYMTEEKIADSLYSNKVLEVIGEVDTASVDQDGGLSVILKSGDPMMVVQCGMRDKGEKVFKGQKISIKGFYSDHDITRVLLTDCIVKKD